jgi:hypothetical protein
MSSEKQEFEIQAVELSIGPCIIFLQKDKNYKSIHVVWGILKNTMNN